MDIKILNQYLIKVNMFIIPKVKRVHFTNLEDSDEESSETYKKMNNLIRTKEIDINLRIYISDIKFQLYMGIEFQNGKVLYRKVTFIDNKIYYDKSGNIAFVPNESKLTLCSTERCVTCKNFFKKVYRCFDCNIPDNKKRRYDFCKACYKHKDHTNHRAIAIKLDDSLFERYPILDNLNP